MPARPYHHGDLPSALLGAVDAIVREDGLEAVTLRAAARRAGVSHAAPAHHFGDKPGLLTAFARQGFEAFTTALRDARDGATEPTPAARIAAMGHAYVRFAREHGPWMQVMFRPELHHHDDPDLVRCGTTSFEVLLEQVAVGLDLAVDDPESLRRAVATWSSVHGLATLLRDGPIAEVADVEVADVEVAGLVDATVATTLDGLRAHPRWVGG